MDLLLDAQWAWHTHGAVSILTPTIDRKSTVGKPTTNPK